MRKSHEFSLYSVSMSNNSDIVCDICLETHTERTYLPFNKNNEWGRADWDGMDMWLGEKRPSGSREFWISQLLRGNHVEDPAKHGEKQSQKTEERLILPTLTQLTGQHGEQPSRKWTVQPHRVGKMDFNRWWHSIYLFLLFFTFLEHQEAPGTRNHWSRRPLSESSRRRKYHSSQEMFLQFVVCTLSNDKKPHK